MTMRRSEAHRTIAQIICLTIAFSRTLKRNYHYYCLIVNLFGLIVFEVRAWMVVCLFVSSCAYSFHLFHTILLLAHTHSARYHFVRGRCTLKYIW